MSIASEIMKSGLAVEWAAEKAACDKHDFGVFVRYVFKDDSQICIDGNGVATYYDPFSGDEA